MNLPTNTEHHTTRVAHEGESRPKREVSWSEARAFAAAPGSIEVIELTPGADFTPYPYHLLVGVKKSDHRDFPLYRVAVGTILADGRFVPGVSPHADIEQLRNGAIVWNGTFDVLTRLLKAAEEWVASDMSYALDRFVTRKGGAPEAQKATTKMQRPGKTERDRARGKAQPKRG